MINYFIYRISYFLLCNYFINWGEYMKRYFSSKIAIIVIILIIAFIGIFLYSRNNVKTDGSINYKEFTIKEGHSGKIEKYDSSNAVEGYQGGKEAYYIKGKVTSTKEQGFILITFNLYDKQDKLLGTAIAGLNTMKKDKAYNFKAVSLIKYEEIKKIDHYSLKDIK